MKTTSFNLGNCIINGIEAQNAVMTVSKFEVGDKVIAISDNMEVTGFITQIDDDSFWLNTIRFPHEYCSFIPA